MAVLISVIGAWCVVYQVLGIAPTYLLALYRDSTYLRIPMLRHRS
jgi:hypothetical protein